MQRVIPLEALVDQAFVEDGDKGVVLDMGRKLKLPVRRLDAPLFLELGGGFSIICSADAVVSWSYPHTLTPSQSPVGQVSWGRGGEMIDGRVHVRGM